MHSYTLVILGERVNIRIYSKICNYYPINTPFYSSFGGAYMSHHDLHVGQCAILPTSSYLVLHVPPLPTFEHTCLQCATSMWNVYLISQKLIQASGYVTASRSLQSVFGARPTGLAALVGRFLNLTEPFGVVNVTENQAKQTRTRTLYAVLSKVAGQTLVIALDTSETRLG